MWVEGLLLPRGGQGGGGGRRPPGQADHRRKPCQQHVGGGGGEGPPRGPEMVSPLDVLAPEPAGAARHPRVSAMIDALQEGCRAVRRNSRLAVLLLMMNL